MDGRAAPVRDETERSMRRVYNLKPISMLKYETIKSSGHRTRKSVADGGCTGAYVPAKKVPKATLPRSSFILQRSASMEDDDVKKLLKDRQSFEGSLVARRHSDPDLKQSAHPSRSHNNPQWSLLSGRGDITPKKFILGIGSPKRGVTFNGQQSSDNFVSRSAHAHGRAMESTIAAVAVLRSRRKVASDRAFVWALTNLHSSVLSRAGAHMMVVCGGARALARAIWVKEVQGSHKYRHTITTDTNPGKIRIDERPNSLSFKQLSIAFTIMKQLVSFVGMDAVDELIHGGVIEAIAFSLKTAGLNFEVLEFLVALVEGKRGMKVAALAAHSEIPYVLAHLLLHHTHENDLVLLFLQAIKSIISKADAASASICGHNFCRYEKWGLLDYFHGSLKQKDIDIKAAICSTILCIVSCSAPVAKKLAGSQLIDMLTTAMVSLHGDKEVLKWTENAGRSLARCVIEDNEDTHSLSSKEAENGFRHCYPCTELKQDKANTMFQQHATTMPTDIRGSAVKKNIRPRTAPLERRQTNQVQKDGFTTLAYEEKERRIVQQRGALVDAIGKKVTTQPERQVWLRQQCSPYLEQITFSPTIKPRSPKRSLSGTYQTLRRSADEESMMKALNTFGQKTPQLESFPRLDGSTPFSKSAFLATLEMGFKISKTVSASSKDERDQDTFEDGQRNCIDDANNTLAKSSPFQKTWKQLCKQKIDEEIGPFHGKDSTYQVPGYLKEYHDERFGVVPVVKRMGVPESKLLKTRSDPIDNLCWWEKEWVKEDDRKKEALKQKEIMTKEQNNLDKAKKKETAEKEKGQLLDVYHWREIFQNEEEKQKELEKALSRVVDNALEHSKIWVSKDQLLEKHPFAQRLRKKEVCDKESQRKALAARIRKKFKRTAIHNSFDNAVRKLNMPERQGKASSGNKTNHQTEGEGITEEYCSTMPALQVQNESSPVLKKPLSVLAGELFLGDDINEIGETDEQDQSHKASYADKLKMMIENVKQLERSSPVTPKKVKPPNNTTATERNQNYLQSKRAENIEYKDVQKIVKDQIKPSFANSSRNDIRMLSRKSSHFALQNLKIPSVS